MFARPKKIVVKKKNGTPLKTKPNTALHMKNRMYRPVSTDPFAGEMKLPKVNAKKTLLFKKE